MRASAELAAAQAALADARAEVDALSRQIAESGPRELRAPCGEAQSSRARVEALEAQEERASNSLGRAEEAVAREREAANQARVAELLTAVRVKDAALTQRVKDFRAELGAGIRELQAVIERANALAYPEGGPLRRTGHGLHWAKTDEISALLFACNVFPTAR